MLIGIDIGGTNFRIGAFDSGNHEVLLHKEKFQLDGEFDTAIKQIILGIKNISNGEKIEGIGIGVSGVVNSEAGYIEVPANLKGWIKKPLVEILSKEFKTIVKLENDAVVVAIGEAMLGFGTKEDKFLYIVWGTGIGGTVVEKINGKLKINPFEPGHQIIDWKGTACPCGQRGCLELYLGGGYAEKRLGKPLAEVTDEKTWDEMAERAAQGLINTIMHHPVKLIVFGGGVITKQEHLLGRIKKLLERELALYPVPELKLTKFGEDAALYGAKALLQMKENYK